MDVTETIHLDAVMNQDELKVVAWAQEPALGWPADVYQAGIVGYANFMPLDCAADLDGTGDVGFTDLLAVLTAWGPCSGCPEDLDGDRSVGFTDLLEVLTAWGPCS